MTDNLLERIDAAILAKHQAIADYANGWKNDISPYWLAAHVAGLDSVLNIGATFLAYVSGELFLAGTRILIAATVLLMFQSAFRSHKRWLSRRDLPQFSTLSEPLFRISFLILSAVVLPYSAANLIMGVEDHPQIKVLMGVSLIAATVCTYFASCKPPSPKFKREEWQPVPNVA